MTEAAQTTTSIIESSVKQTGEALNATFMEILKYAIVLAIIAIAFLFVKFIIVTAFKNRNKSKTEITAQPINKNNNQQMYYLEKEQLEIIRLFDKLSDEDKADFKAKMYQALKEKKLKI